MQLPATRQRLQRTLGVAAAIVAVISLGARSAAAIDPLTNSPTCSVFDGRPCTPSFCGVFDGSPCVPEVKGPIGQDMRLTIESRDLAAAIPPDAEKRLDSMRVFFAALRACWEPPPIEQAQSRLEMSVRLSFNRNGDIIGRPRVTYTSPDTPYETKEVYWRAITAALQRCTPMPFSKAFGNAVAGRPIAIRFVDNRK
jgi:hypothetical protein